MGDSAAAKLERMRQTRRIEPIDPSTLFPDEADAADLQDAVEERAVTFDLLFEDARIVYLQKDLGRLQTFAADIQLNSIPSLALYGELQLSGMRDVLAGSTLKVLTGMKKETVYRALTTVAVALFLIDKDIADRHEDDDDAGYDEEDEEEVGQITESERLRRRVAFAKLRAPLSIRTPTVSAWVTLYRGTLMDDTLDLAEISKSTAYARRTTAPVRETSAPNTRLAWAYVVYLDQKGPQRRVPSRALSEPRADGQSDPRNIDAALDDEYLSYTIRTQERAGSVQEFGFSIAVGLGNVARFSATSMYAEVGSLEPDTPAHIYIKLSPSAAARNRIRTMTDVQRIYVHPIALDSA
jgi:hypothetical protein